MAPFRLLFPLFLCLGFASAEEVTRKWTDTTGRSFDGTYVSSTATSVTIRRADGKVFEVDAAKLSKEDRDYVAILAKAPATPPKAEAQPELKYHPEDPRSYMLKGYEANPNFSAPWPKDAGVDKEPEITVIEEKPDDNRFIYESPHYRFQSNVALRPSLLSKVALMFEASYQMHHALPLNNRRTRSPKAPKMNAFLFETMAQYLKAGGLSGSAGVYMTEGDKFMVPLESLGVKKVGSGYMFDYSGDFHTMFHELTHQLWADLGEYAGIWMVEGFAEFVACAPFSNSGKFSFTKQPSYALEYVTAYGKKDHGGRALGKEFSMPHLEQILNWTQPQFYKDANNNYGFGLILTYYFILLDGDGQRFKDCIKACQEGKSREEALKVVMGERSYGQLEDEISAAYKKKGIKITFK